MNLRKTLAVGAAAAGMLAAAASPASAAHGAGDQTVGLNGANEVGTDGDPNGSGTIELSFFRAAGAPTIPEELRGAPYICYELTVRNVDEATGLHIHEVSGAVANPRKDTGGVVVNLLADTVAEGDATCVSVDEEVFEGILEDPDEYYVNYHTAAQPAGAIRGQLHAFS